MKATYGEDQRIGPIATGGVQTSVDIEAFRNIATNFI
jgi:hypothetical protein